nr:uncharacterized protein LOC129042369 isoform X3 [Pongo pygmaeus]
MLRGDGTLSSPCTRKIFIAEIFKPAPFQKGPAASLQGEQSANSLQLGTTSAAESHLTQVRALPKMAQCAGVGLKGTS